MMIENSAKTRFVCFAVTLLVPAFSQAGTWASPTVLSTGGQGWQAAAAIDGTGNSVAIWDEITSLAQLWSRSKPSGGNWGAVTEVSPALEANSIYPAVRVSAAGFATAVWSDQGGVWTADRPPASNWSSPRLLVPGVSNPIFVMNSQGAAAIVWSVGGPRSTSSQVLAVLRPAGGSWSAQQLVTSARACYRRSCGNRHERRGDRDVGNLQRNLHQIWLLGERLRFACLPAECGYRLLGRLGLAAWARQRNA